MNKKKIILISSIIFLIGIALSVSIIFKPVEKTIPIEEPIVVENDESKARRVIDLTSLRTQYNNQDIITYIEIPGVLETPVVQTTDNDYYLNHDLYKNDDIKGSVELDYRNTLDDRKLILYGHSGKEQELPFLPLNNYTEESFFKEHEYIYLYTETEERKYHIFATYIETEDFDYVNLNSFNGLTYKEHLEKLKSKSLFQTDIKLEDNSKIIILQTCSMTNRGSAHYHLVIAKEEERNSY